MKRYSIKVLEKRKYYHFIGGNQTNYDVSMVDQY